MKPIQIIPAILVKTKAEYQKRLRQVQGLVKTVQVDIMDGLFVPNKTVQLKELIDTKTNLSLEIQLMVKDPFKYLEDCKKLNAQIVIFHYESLKSDYEILRFIREARSYRLKVSIAINPQTPAQKLFPYIPLIDQVLVMTVNPGFGAQKLIPSTLKKIEQIRKKYKDIDIEVDGGINQETAPLVTKAGANKLVEGSAIFKAPDIEKAIKEIKDSCRGGICI